MTPEQEELAEYMSWISEECYCAGWMMDLEYNLWEIVIGERSHYGMREVEQSWVAKLKAMSEAAGGGWIVWSHGEQYVDQETWIQMFEAWRKSKWQSVVTPSGKSKSSGS